MSSTGNRWSEAEAHLSAADPAMAALVAAHAPCQLRPDDDLFTGLLSAIVSQQLSVKASATIFTRFTGLYGGAPTPQAVAETPEEPLRAAGMSRAKTVYVRDLAARVGDGRLDLNQLQALPDEAVIEQLTAVKGIGRWTAEMILIFHLNRPDVLPVDDLGIREGFKRAYNLPERPAPDQMQAMAEPWRPWRSVGSWYLWRVLDNEPLTKETTS